MKHVAIMTKFKENFYRKITNKYMAKKRRKTDRQDLKTLTTVTDYRRVRNLCLDERKKKSSQ